MRAQLASTRGKALTSLSVGLALVAGLTWSSQADVTAYYRCRLGQPPERLSASPPALAPERLATLAQWDAFAVQAIARAVTGNTTLQQAWPLFEALLRSGLFAGAYGDTPETRDAFLALRGRRLLDACRRLATGPPLQLIRDLLRDEALVARLREETLGDARSTAEWFFTERLRGGQKAAAWGQLLPFLLSARGSLADGDLLERCLQGVEQGKLPADAAAFLGRTLLWDLRLYLLSKPAAADLAAAVALPDEALGEDVVTALCVAHLKCFLLGGADLQATDPAWLACDAAGFVAAHPGWQWVGHAAALAHELRRGTVLRVVADTVPVLMTTGATMPVVFSVTPALGATYAVPVLVWPRSPQVAYEGLCCLQDTRLMNWPAPVSGAPVPCGLQYTVSFTKAGPGRIGFQYKLCGLELPMVTHVVDVATADAEDRPGSRQRVIVEPSSLPSGYGPVFSSTGGALSRKTRIITGGRRFTELADGVHGMEHVITYEVLASDRDDFPAEFVFCDPNPRGDRTVAERADMEAEAVFPPAQAAGFALAPSRARVHGRDCWVGRKGKGADGRHYYVLCRGTQTYCRRNASFPRQDYWEPLPGEQEVYDATRIRDDTVAFAEAVLAIAQSIGGTTGPTADGPRADVGQTLALLSSLKSTLDEEASLRERALRTLADWRQGALGKETAAQSVGEVFAAYGALTARAAGLQAPDGDLVGLLEGLRTTLSIGAAAAHLIGKGIADGEEEKLTRAVALLDGHKAQREALRAKITAAEVAYRATQTP